MQFIGPRADALRGFGSASKAAFRSPTSWISLLIRCCLLIAGSTFILQWIHHNEHWSITKSLSDVISSPILLGILLWLGAFGRAIADHEFSLDEFRRALIQQLIMVPPSLGLWFVLGGFLHCLGYTSLSSIVFPLATFAYLYRASSFETDRVLAKISLSERF